MDLVFIQQAFGNFLALLISLSFHEAAHAFCAKWQGDDTAQREGRLSLNPLVHADPVGTFILPLSSIFLQLPFLFGWAKPVPVNNNRLRHGLTSQVLVAAAGPGINLFLCTLSILSLGVYGLYGSELIPKGHFLYPLVSLTAQLAVINAVLAVFNLIPLPPLDGGTVIRFFLPESVGEKYEEALAPMGGWILLILMASGGLKFIWPIAQAYIAMNEFAMSWFLNIFRF